MVKWIIVAILLLPLAEIAIFALVAALIGTVFALLLMLATSVAGFLVLRRAGRGRLANLRVAVADTDITAIEANTSGFLTVLGGLLLLLPGFLTDLIGAALLLAPVRRWCGERFRRVVHTRDPRDRSVVDLTPGEWRQVPDGEAQRKRDDRIPR